MSKLCIVIVNWNSGTQLQQCLSSLASARIPKGIDPEVVVVDNGSSDGSSRFLDDFGVASFETKLIEAQTNLGFGRACNLGFERFVEEKGIPDFVLFLNPDTEVFPDTFDRLLSESDLQDPAYGIFGVQLVDDTGVATTCSNFPTALNFTVKLAGLGRLVPGWPAAHHHMTYFDHRSDRTVDQVMGAFFLVRGTLFQALGGFDPDFFVYFEEVDFSLRASHEGHATRFLAGPRTYHRGQGTTSGVKPFRQFLSVRSRLRYFRKHHGRAACLYIALIGYAIEMPLRVLRALSKGDSRGGAGIVQAYSRVLSGSDENDGFL